MPRAKRVGRTVSVSRRGELAFFDFFVDYVVPYFEVTGKGMSAETPMKTLGKSSSIGSPIGSSKTPLENMVNTTQEAREKTREKILGLVCASANISTDEMASQLGITRKGIEWHIRKLKAENILHRIGPDKGGHWEVLK
ncbi:MAG: winged helix-turn-helix transcriptional regulator [bacterium]